MIKGYVYVTMSTRCIDCLQMKHQKDLYVKGYFDVKINDELLLVPSDFECIDFTRKEERYKKNKEKVEKSSELISYTSYIKN